MPRKGDCTPPEVRFWAKVVEGDNGCWLWTGARKALGYGSFYDGTRNVNAYRWAYEQMIGEVPAGLVLDHLCANPPCVNPYHLDPVTHSVNAKRGRYTPKPQNLPHELCKRGLHRMAEDAYISPNGLRHCKPCRVKQMAERHKEKMVAIKVLAIRNTL